MSRFPVAAPRAFVLSLAASSVLLLGACASSRQSGDGFFASITPYRIEIVQGNVVTSEQVARVKPGLSRNQVRDILGTPLLADPFHGDRWDYLFTLRRDGLPLQRRSVVVWFEGDALKTIEAPDLPSERDFVQGISVMRSKPEPRVLELTDEQRKALPLPPKRDEVAGAQPQGPARAYPALGD
jgi:outer membrane protein assembly factor BamE